VSSGLLGRRSSVRRLPPERRETNAGTLLPKVMSKHYATRQELFPTTPFRRSVSRRHLTGIIDLGLWNSSLSSGRGSEQCMFGVLSLNGAIVQDVLDRESVETN
jgi:hypothetical protein